MAKTQRVMILVESRGDRRVHGPIGQGSLRCPSRQEALLPL